MHSPVWHESLSRRRRRYNVSAGIHDAYAKKLADNLGPKWLLTIPSSSEKVDGIALRRSAACGDLENRLSRVVVSCRTWVVVLKKPAAEELSGHRFLAWVIRHLNQSCNKSIHPVAITGGYCWSTSFNVLGVLFLGEVSSAFLPSKKASWTPKFRHLGVDQQYPKVFLHTCGGRNPLILSTFSVVFCL